ncbi:glycosyltransferase [Microbacterium kunmingense]|uniref:glycosyltransferase n=1 Tax=Microbacterium kunmingense TaxID=2915939 RepID=UPI003D744791
MKARITIVQPYVPMYRVDFFELLRKRLDEEGIELRLVAGVPDPEQARRADAAKLDWVEEVAWNRVRFAGRSAVVSRTRRLWSRDAGVILPLMGSNLDIYDALIERRKRGLRVGLWGHVANYTTHANPVDAFLERFQMRHADHVFAYTQSGADFAAEAGVHRARITTVRNTVPTDGIQAAIDRVTRDEVEKFCNDHAISGRTYAYIGGLDASKRVDLLAEVLDELWVQDPSAKVLVGGSGSQRHMLECASKRGQVVMLGVVGDAEKAMIAKVASALINPGRIGLVAVDALVMRLPVVTINWPFHAPEADYLVPGKDVEFTDPSAAALTRTLLSMRRTDYGHMSTPPDIRDMVENFATGVRSMVDGADA